MDLQKYWRDVREVMADLPERGVIYLVSIDNQDKGTTAGQVMDFTDRKQAARRIVEKTHVPANQLQVEQHLEAQRINEAQLAKIEMGRKDKLAMPQELQDLVRLATKGAIAEQGSAPAQESTASPGKPGNK